ncbi:MFS transporter [Kitasatospora acidiphila]|uniref:MFS transporter n=1 Tax=Kitasatospora acidiphila TaxID=2567942 RepID=UPI0015F0C70F|nr:MFS transporter [Kitasatospora acidiphila]
MRLTASARRFRLPAWCTRPVLVLLLASFISSVGVLLFAPYLALYLHRDEGLPAGLAGIVLGLSYWSTRAVGLVAGGLADRFGPVRVMVAGNAVRAVGVLLLTGTSPLQITLAVLLVGGGAGLFFPISKACLLRLVDSESQLKALAARNVCANAGVAIGPLAGMAVFAHGPALLLDAAAVVFGGLTLVLLVVPEGPRRPAGVSYWSSVARVLASRTVIVAVLATTVLGAAIVQLESAFPLLAGQGAPATVGILFLVNAGMVIVAQPALVKAVARFSARSSMSGGLLCFAVSFAVAAAAGGRWLWLAAAVVVFSIAEVWVSLWIDDLVRREGADNAATIYGISGLGDAFGGLAGAMVGGVLVAADSGLVPGVRNSYWLLGAAVLVAMAIGQLLLPRDQLKHGRSAEGRSAEDRSAESPPKESPPKESPPKESPPKESPPKELPSEQREASL